MKIIFPILMVVPGIIGFALYPKLKSGDDVYATMLCNLLPKGVFGLVFTGFLAAFMSTVDSYLNSASTLWTMDIYKRYIKKEATPHHLMMVGKILTVVFIILAGYLAKDSLGEIRLATARLIMTAIGVEVTHIIHMT